MGIMIVVGVAAVVGRILYLASNKPPTAAAQVPATMASGTVGSGKILEKISIVLPGNASAQQIHLNGSHLAVLYQHNANSKPNSAVRRRADTGIVVVDLTTGKVISRISVANDRVGASATDTQSR